MISLNSSNSSWIPPLTYRWIEAEGEIDCTIFFDIKNVQQAQAMISCRGKRSFYPVEWTFPLISKEKVCQFLLKQHQEPYFQIRVERQGEQFKIYLDCQKLSQKADKIIQKLNVEIFTANSMRVSLFVDWYNEREDKEERKHFLLDTILSTPTKPHNKVVAANSATILNQGRYSFSRLNLQGIQIPYANLPRVILEGANLRGADLRHTSLVNGCLTNADLRGCRMEGIDFRLKPHLEVDVTVLALALYPLNDRYVAVGGIGRHILIIDLDTRETFAKLPVDSRESESIGTVISLEFSPDGKVLVAGLSDETLMIWDTAYLGSKNHSRPKCLMGDTLFYSVQPSSKNLINFTHVKFPSHPNYQQLLIVNRSNGMLQCLQTTNFEEIEKWRLQINAKCIYSFCFFPKIPHLLAIACNESIGIWDALSKKEIQKLCTIRDKAEVLFSPDGRFLAANTKQGIFIWETERWEQIKKFDAHSIPTISMPLHFSADSLLFAYATGNSPLYLIQASDWQVITSLTGGRKEITSVQISLKKGMVLLGNEKQIQLHILEDTTSSHQPLFQTAIRGILISPDSQFFFTLRENCLTQTNLLTLEEKIWPLKKTDEGCDSTFTILPFNSPHLLEVKSKNDLDHTSYIIVHDLTEEKSTQLFEGTHLSGVEFIEKTPYITYYRKEGNRLVWEVWDIHQQKAIQPLSHYAHPFYSGLDSDPFLSDYDDLIDLNLTLSPSGKYVVSIDESDLSLLSCAKTGLLEEIGNIKLRNEIDKPEYLQFSKDEKLFALGQQGKVEKNLRSIVRFWNLDSLKEMPSFYLPLTHKPFTSMDLSSSGKLLAISQEHSIYLWDVERSHLGEELLIGLEVKKVRFSPDTGCD